MGDYTPVQTVNLQPYTSTASAIVVGGQLVAVSGPGTVAPAAEASTTVVGVAAHDSGPGVRLTVHPLAGMVHEFVAGTGGVTAGDTVMAGSAPDEVLPLTGQAQRVGVALTTAPAGSLVQVLGGGADAAASGGGSVAWTDITGKPTTFAPTIGTTSTTAAAGNHTHPALTADQAAGTASVRTLGTGAQQAAAGNHTHSGLMTGSATAVNNSVAADIATLVSNYNTLLAALRTRGIITGS